MAPKLRQRVSLPTKEETPAKKRNEQNSFKTSEKSKNDSKPSSSTTDHSSDTAFRLLIAARLIAAITSYISDCDETYNYWEPGHYLLYGTGQQTWEYSPQYALRSYAYLLIHMVPAKLYWYILSFFHAEPNPMHIFYFVRCVLSFVCTISEVYLYRNIGKEFGIHVARIALGFSLLSSGMYISSAAFLPSSFSMCFSTAAIAAWFGHKYELAIFYTAISSLLGWPFAALLGVPIAVDMLFRKRNWLTFFSWVIISAIVILGPMIFIDSMYYGKLTIAPLNLIMYNVFTDHGPDLYGTEPFSYYFMNGFLNFNFVFGWAMLTPALIILAHYFLPLEMRHPAQLPFWLSLAPLYLWFLVFFFQPHKEERFLFPVYPLICLHGAITIDVVQKLYFHAKSKAFNYAVSITNNYVKCTKYVMIFAIIICGCFGLSRTYALYNGYHAPMDIMAEVNKLGMSQNIPKDMEINFCVGKEWHRFPSSFFFPSNNWKLRYIKSEFKGQLPQAYAQHENATSMIQPHFNDKNEEERSRYFDVEKCHFMMDLDVGRITKLEPNYSHKKGRFRILKSVKFLDNLKSDPVYRAFYIPYMTEENVAYGSYNLLQNNKYKFSEKKI
ncbi:alpha-1,2-mannosyltransferase ALG9 [Trichogramma pretiosum]|uniref:alpha-1,2-mannosyltransferase ALG9 n=1 Tax=Trichogramma pretiosum TaxID=7493 RepID=UPI0006C976A0|nr:alpha-1,2-mannosyltransferase ALG9 [Trichogramma pretiosum]